MLASFSSLSLRSTATQVSSQSQSVPEKSRSTFKFFKDLEKLTGTTQQWMVQGLGQIKFSSDLIDFALMTGQLTTENLFKRPQDPEYLQIDALAFHIRENPFTTTPSPFTKSLECVDQQFEEVEESELETNEKMLDECDRTRLLDEDSEDEEIVTRPRSTTILPRDLKNFV